MLDNWLLVAFIAPMLWSLVNLIDVYFVNDVYRDEYDGTIISGLFPLLPWTLVLFGIVKFDFPDTQWMWLLLGGCLFLFANFFYFKSLFRNNDAALVQIFWNLTVPFTLLLSWLLFQESLNLKEYIGIVIVLIGVVYLSLQEKEGEWKIRDVLKNIIPASVLLASSLVCADYAYGVSDIHFFDGYLVFALGMVLGALIINLFDKTSLRNRFSQITVLTKKYFLVFFSAELLALIGTITSQRALDLSPSPSFVATIESLSPVFVMLFSVIIVVLGRTLVRGFAVNESLYNTQFSALGQKFFAIATIAIGIFLVS